MADFELKTTIKSFNRVPVTEYVSKRTGLTVYVANVPGPIVNGYFCLATEAFDDDGLPHTLEHLIFLGSDSYPYKGVLDLLANRCLASGTNAWTDVDHTCYTMETAGSEGFCVLMPIFLDHILYPILSDEAFITEVHHVTSQGDDAGVVYCEMQGRENSAESRMHLNLLRAIYPGRCGYSSETGGIMENLRDSTTNAKVRRYHQDFYRPENLKIIIIGRIEPKAIFEALAPIEAKIVSRHSQARSEFVRPFQAPVPPLLESQHLIIQYPADEETNGNFAMAWRGPSSVTDVYTLTGCSILLKYLTESAISPLPKLFVEIDEPRASNVCHSIYENSESAVALYFQDVPRDKMASIKAELVAELLRLRTRNDIDLERMSSLIRKQQLENLSNLENQPHSTLAFMIIGHQLYGNTLSQRLNPIKDLDKLMMEPIEYWINLLDRYLINNCHVSIECHPSRVEKAKMTARERDRVTAQRNRLGLVGLERCQLQLTHAISVNDRPPPNDMLTSVKVPSCQSIEFHRIDRYTSDEIVEGVDLTRSRVYTYFDNIDSSFVFLSAMLDTSGVPAELRLYLPLLVEALLELPIERNNVIVPFEQIVSELDRDTTARGVGIGLGGTQFQCGPFANHVILQLQVENGKFHKGIQWLDELLCGTKFTRDRVKVVALKMLNAIAQCKRQGRLVAATAVKLLWYATDSNVNSNTMLVQNRFLTDVVRQLSSDDGQQHIIEDLDTVRANITKHITMQVSGKLSTVDIGACADVFAHTTNELKPLKAVPDYLSFNSNSSGGGGGGTIIGLASTESAFFYLTVPCQLSVTDPDYATVRVYLQYLIQAEGPMWKQIRGKGYAYYYGLNLRMSEGLIYMILGRATNVLGAYEEANKILTEQLTKGHWDGNLVDSAKASLIFTLIEQEQTVSATVALSQKSIFQDVDYNVNRNLLEKIRNVTESDLNRVGGKYLTGLIRPDLCRCALVIDSGKVEEIAEGFAKLGLNLTVYHSLEDSILD